MITLLQDEHVDRILRKHWFVLFQEVIGVVVLMVVPFIVFPFLRIMLQSINPELIGAGSIPEAIIVFAASLWLLVMWIWLFTVWTDFYLDIWIITTKRVIDINQEGFFTRQVYTFGMEQIQDITVVTPGFFGTVFNYGNIHVQTAGAARDRHIMRGIHDPQRVRELLFTYYEKLKRGGAEKA